MLNMTPTTLLRPADGSELEGQQRSEDCPFIPAPGRECNARRPPRVLTEALIYRSANFDDNAIAFIPTRNALAFIFQTSDWICNG